MVGLLVRTLGRLGVRLQKPLLIRAEQRRRSRELALVSLVSRAVTAGLDLETTLDRILATVGDFLPYVAAQVCLWDSEENVLSSRVWGGDPAYRLGSSGIYAPGEGYTGWIALHQKPLLIPRVDTYDEVKPQFESSQVPVGSYVGVPLMVDDALVGSLELVSNEPNTYRPQDLDLLEAVANQATVAIEYARLSAVTQRTNQEVSILYEAASALSSRLSVNEVLHDLAQRVASALEADECAISEWDEAGGILWTLLREQPAEGADAPASRTDSRRVMFVRDEPYAVADFPTRAEVLRSRAPAVVLASDPQADPAEVALLDQSGWRSKLMWPLIQRDAVVGLVEICHAEERGFTNDDLRLARALTGQTAIALQNALLSSLTDERLHKRIKELAGLQRVSQELNSTLERNRILQMVLREAVRATGADFGNVNLHNKEHV